MRHLSNELTDKQLDVQIAACEKQIVKQQQDMSKFTSSKKKQYTSDQVTAIQVEFNLYYESWLKNKKGVKNIVEMLRGESTKKTKDIEVRYLPQAQYDLLS